MLGVLLGLVVVRKQFTRKLAESVTDPVVYDQMALIGQRLEWLALLAIFFAMGTAHWLLRGILS